MSRGDSGRRANKVNVVSTACLPPHWPVVASIKEGLPALGSVTMAAMFTRSDARQLQSCGGAQGMPSEPMDQLWPLRRDREAPFPRPEGVAELAQ